MTFSPVDRLNNSEERVRNGAAKLTKFLNVKQQGRLDGFFTAKPKTSPKKEKEKPTEKGKGTKRKVCTSSNSCRLTVVDSCAVSRRMTRRAGRQPQAAAKNQRKSN